MFSKIFKVLLALILIFSSMPLYSVSALEENKELTIVGEESEQLSNTENTEENSSVFNSNPIEEEDSIELNESQGDEIKDVNGIIIETEEINKEIEIIPHKSERNLKKISNNSPQLNMNIFYGSSFALISVVDSENSVFTAGRELPYDSNIFSEDIWNPKVKKLIKHYDVSNRGYIDLEGNLWIWGSNVRGQLGTGQKTPSSVTYENKVNIPLKNVKEAFIGTTSIAILEDGTVWQWGKRMYELPNGTAGYYEEFYKPERVLGIENAVSIEQGDEHFLILTEEGYVFTWGFDGFRKLGRSCDEKEYTPNTHYSGVYTTPLHLGDCLGEYMFGDIVKIESGHFTSFALNKNGDLYAWGSPAYNMFGYESKKELQTPTKMNGFDGKIIDYSIADSHGLAIDEYGQIYSWGSNGNGQLGLGFADSVNYQGINKIPIETRYISVYTKGSSSFALDTEGNLWIWGGLSHYFMGPDNKYSTRHYPMKISDFKLKLDGLEEYKREISGRNAEFIKNRDESKIDKNSLIADPIDTATGALVIEENLFPTGKAGTSYIIDYNSISNKTGLFGDKWFSLKDNKITKINSHVSEVRISNLSSFEIKKDINGSLKTNNPKFSVEQRNSHTYVTDEKGNIYYYPYSNALSKITFLSNDYLEVDGPLRWFDTVNESLDRKIQSFNYYPRTIETEYGKRISRLFLNSVTYGSEDYYVDLKYNKKGNLEEIIRPDGEITKYIYDSNGNIIEGYKNNILFMKNEFDDKSRVVKQFDSLGNSTTFNYKEDGNSISTIVTNRNGSSKKLIHDINYNLITEINEVGEKTQHIYDENNNRIKTVFNNNSHIEMTYDDKDNLILIRNQLGNETKMTYEENGNLLTILNPLGEKVVNSYNELRQITRVDYSNGNYIEFIYSNNLLHKTKDYYGNVVTYNYYNGLINKITNKNNKSKEFKYNYLGHISQIKDEKGRVEKFEYDSNVRVTKTINPLNQVIEKTYNPFGDVTSIIDFSGLTTLYDYDNNGYLKKQKVEDREMKFNYDNEGNLIESISPKGYSSTSELDALGRVIKETDTEGLITTYKYDSVGNLVEMNFNGAITKNKYDAANNLIEVTNPEGNVTKYEYDKLGRVSKETNALGGITSYTYDFNSNITSISDPEGNVIRNEYDFNGNKTKTIDAKGNAYSYEYDPAGRLVKEINPLGEVNTFEYDAVDNLTISRNNASKIYAKEYDVLDRLTVEKDPHSNSIKYTYDESGNLKETVDALGNKVVSVKYDKFNNPIEVEDVFGNKIKNVFDSENNLIETIDQLNRSTKYEYDTKGRVKKITDKSGTVSIVNYDQYGNISSFTDPNENNTNYTFNKMGQIATEVNQTGNTLRYTYDKLGQMSSYKNGRGQESTYDYDKVGNVKKVISPEGVTTYEYDANYNVTKVSEKIGSVTKTVEYKYDSLNRMTEYKDEFGNVIKYKYDSVGNLSELTYPDGKKVKYGYDDVGNLVNVTDWNNHLTSYTYDKNYNLIKTVLPNKTSEVREYDKKGQLTKLTHLDKSGSVMKEYTYQYDAVGNVIKENNKTYQYDKLDRIIKVNSDEYEYDAAGNITLVKKDGQEVDMTYGADNQLTGIQEQNLDYDNDGNLLNVPLKDSLAEAVYDSKNRLIQLGNNEYSYSPTGKRTSIVEGGETTYFVINPNGRLDQVLMETNADGSPTAYYVHGDGLISKYDVESSSNEDSKSEEEPENRSIQVRYYHYDSRGSTILLTNAAGVITDTIEYDIYGEILESTGNTENRFKYNGKFGVQTDTTGLYQMRSRYYNPEIKRFINRDVVIGNVLDPQTFNRYSYVNGNPVNFIDPFGLSRETEKNFFKAAYDFIIGDDINTLMDPNASALEKMWAGVSIGSNFIPGAGPAVKGISWTVKGAGKLFGKANKLCPINCFVAGTLVLTKEGYIPVEEIEIGDKVLAKDDQTGDIQYKEVVSLFNREADRIYTIEVGSEEIKVTGEHPFWVIGKGWVETADLEVGDILTTFDRQELPIKDIIVEDKTTTVYNFEVADYHTYFVSELGIWTHNCYILEHSRFSIAQHGFLKQNKKRAGSQSHHFLQDKAFKGVIPYDKSIAIELQGHASSKGTEHNLAHQVLERFWDNYRDSNGVHDPLKGKPTVNEYLKVANLSLYNAKVPYNVRKVILRDSQNLLQEYGLHEQSLVPSVPKKMKAVKY